MVKNIYQGRLRIKLLGRPLVMLCVS